MQKIHLSEIKNLVEYEKARDAMRADIIAMKRHRRVSCGPNLTFLFENRGTVIFQIQEMVRTERIVEDRKIQDEIDTYNALVPDEGQLSATLFIEIPGIANMTNEAARIAVNRFQGLDKEAVFLKIGEHSVAPRFEGGHSKEEKMAAVQYLRFELPKPAQAALADAGTRVRLVVDHPAYKAEQELPPDVRAELLRDLGESTS